MSRKFGILEHFFEKFENIENQAQKFWCSRTFIQKLKEVENPLFKSYELLF